MRGLSTVVKRYIITWHIVTVILYLLAVGAVVLVFPDVSNLWVSIFVLVSGFTASVGALAAALAAADQG